MPRPVAAVGRHLGRGVSAHPRGDGAEAGGGEFRQQVAPGVRRVWEAMQAQRMRSVGRPFGQRGERASVGPDFDLGCRRLGGVRMVVVSLLSGGVSKPANGFAAWRGSDQRGKFSPDLRCG